MVPRRDKREKRPKLDSGPPPGTGFSVSADGRSLTYDQPLDTYPGWKVVARIEEEDGTAVIVSVALERGWGGLVDVVPAAGTQPEATIRSVTSTMLRSVTLAEIVEGANKWLAAKAPSLGALPRPRRGGHGGRVSELDHAIWAGRYVNALQQGSPTPNADLAKRYNLKHEQIRDIVRVCRTRLDLLTPAPTQGRPGGQLTEKATRLLEAAQKRPPRPPRRTKSTRKRRK